MIASLAHFTARIDRTAGLDGCWLWRRRHGYPGGGPCRPDGGLAW